MLEKLELDDEGKGLHSCSVLFAYFMSIQPKLNFHLFFLCVLDVVFAWHCGENVLFIHNVISLYIDLIIQYN